MHAQSLIYNLSKEKTAKTEDSACLDITVNGLWGGILWENVSDVQIFNPYGPSHMNIQLSACYKKHEKMKKREYQQKVRKVEHASVTPLVLLATSRMATEATHFYCTGNYNMPGQ